MDIRGRTLSRERIINCDLEAVDRWIERLYDEERRTQAKIHGKD